MVLKEKSGQGSDLGSQIQTTTSRHGYSPQQEIQRRIVFRQSKTNHNISTRLFAPTGRFSLA